MQTTDQQKLVAVAIRKLDSLNRITCFDPVNPESRPTTAQQEVINEFGTIPVQYIVAGSQSGKSQTCSRLITWALTETHPSWTRPVEWGREPLLCLVAGRTGKQIEESLLPKLRSYLEPGTYKEVRIGNMIQRLELNNGNRIVFQSLENPNIARERIQSYVAHLAWVDEMAQTDDIIDEVLRRVQARGGYLLASFTPLVENIRIQKRVDAATPPFARKYQFAMLDNPLYADPQKRAKILEEMSVLPESVRNTRLYGAWSSSDQAVYRFDWATMAMALPEYYQRSWRHVEAVDPALKSALGLTVWGEDPRTGKWYLVHSEQISGIHDPIELEATVNRKTQQYNIIKRISDTEPFYVGIARRAGRHVICVYNKANRKGELIKQLQVKLGTQVFIPPHNSEFIDQLTGCKWSDSDQDRIINTASHHMLDSAQYFCDNIPKWEGTAHLQSWEQQLREANTVRVKQEQAQAKRIERKHTLIRRRR